MFQAIPFLTYVFVSAITPGPNNILSMSNGSRLGFKKALPFNAGVAVGFVMVMLLCTAFASLLRTVLPAIKLPMKIIGALYILYLAYKTLRSKGEIEENHSKSGFVQGMVLQFMNPKIILYGILSMEVYILPHFGDRPLMLALFALVLATIGASCTLLWSAFGSVFKRLFSEHGRVVNTIMAIALLYCAVSLFL